MIDLIDMVHVRMNVAKTDAVIARLRELGYTDPEVLGGLGADLGDLYASAQRYQRLLDELLAPGSNRGRIGDLLIDLAVEMDHMRGHLEGGIGRVEQIADDFE